MVIDLQPVASVCAFAVDRDRTVCETIENHDRDQLFRKLGSGPINLCF